MNRFMERTRYLVAAVSLALVALAVLDIGWGVARTVRFAWVLFDTATWTTSKPIAQALQVVDVLLVGTTILVVASGLWELFVSDIELPEWLAVASLRDLETKIADLVVIVVAIKYVERFIAGGDALDLLYEAAAILLVGSVLLALGRLKGK